MKEPDSGGQDKKRDKNEKQHREEPTSTLLSSSLTYSTEIISGDRKRLLNSAYGASLAFKMLCGSHFLSPWAAERGRTPTESSHSSL